MDGFVSGEIPDYQMSALMMAIVLNDMNEREAADLTLSMMRSGDTVDLSDLPGISDTLSLLAEILEKQGRVTDALALYREAWQQLGTTGHQKRLASPAMDRGLARAPGVTVGILR